MLARSQPPLGSVPRHARRIPRAGSRPVAHSWWVSTATMWGPPVTPGALSGHPWSRSPRRTAVTTQASAGQRPVGRTPVRWGGALTAIGLLAYAELAAKLCGHTRRSRRTRALGRGLDGGHARPGVRRRASVASRTAGLRRRRWSAASVGDGRRGVRARGNGGQPAIRSVDAAGNDRRAPGKEHVQRRTAGRVGPRCQDRGSKAASWKRCAALTALDAFMAATAIVGSGARPCPWLRPDQEAGRLTILRESVINRS